MKKMLEADSIWLEYDGRKILQSIYLKLETGTVTGLLGRNGTGKSSLMQLIFGTLRGQSQSVRVDGVYMQRPFMQPGLIRFLPQHHFLPDLPLQELCDAFQVNREILLRYFPDFENSLKMKANELSGGKVRIFEAMLVLLSPVSFVLLDEPFTHVAPVAVEILMEVIREQSANKGILVADHLYRQVLGVSDEVHALIPVGRSVLLKDPEHELRALGYLL